MDISASRQRWDNFQTPANHLKYFYQELSYCLKLYTNYLNEMSRLCLSSPYGGRGEQPASRGAQRALPDIDGCLVALFGAQSSLSVKRHDGRRYGRLRYPCTSLMQEARAL